MRLLLLTRHICISDTEFVADSVDSILARFADAGGFTAQEVVALLVSFVLNRLAGMQEINSQSFLATLLLPPTTWIPPSPAHRSTPLRRSSTVNSSLKPSFVALSSLGVFIKYHNILAVNLLVHTSTAGNQGEVESPLAGEMRLQSDSEVKSSHKCAES